MDPDFVAVLQRHLKYSASQEITQGSRLRDLGLDSLRAIDLLFDIEDTYGVTVPDDLLSDTTFDTGGALWSVIEKLRPGAEEAQR